MKEKLKKITRFLFKLMLWFLGLSIFSVIVFRFIPVPITPLMLIRCSEQLIDGKDLKLKKDWVSIEKIAPTLPLAVFCSEDQNFLNHNGIDFESIEKALKDNKKRKIKRGASTISQQTAKNLFLWPSRSYLRKGLEVYFTVLIEFFWSKERIMEVYLNIIEMGNGVYGAEAAAQEFFKKPASKLNKSESALIAAVLPNPRKFNAGKPSAYTKKRQAWVMRQMDLWGGKLELN